MSKKEFLLAFVPFLAASFILLLCWYLFAPPPSSKTVTPVKGDVVSPTPAPSHMKSSTFNGITYSFDAFEVDISHLMLLENFTARKTVQEVMQEHNCSFAVNAGFYTTDYKPLGLFIGQNYAEPTPLKSALFNGFLSFSKTSADISSSPPNIFIGAVQTGPLLIENGKSTVLSIQNDTHDRRVIGETTHDGRLVFLVIFTKDSLYQGPLLEDLPTLLTNINAELHLSATNAINLDGGTASAFISPFTTIQELAPVGGVFCQSK